MLGSLWDWFTLGRPDRLFANAILLSYLALAGGGILIMSRLQEKKTGDVPIFLLGLIQFAFGNLASALLILYGLSGTLSGNWLFFLIFGAFIVGNEFLRGRYNILRFNVSVYYLLILAYLAIIVPILMKEISTRMFILSGMVSIVVIFAFLIALRIVSPRVTKNSGPLALLAVAAILTSFNVLYFFNFIPPVPLALKDMGIYHSVSRDSAGVYKVSYEDAPWYDLSQYLTSSFHYHAGENAYCFTSVFAPAGLSTPIYHRWEYYDPTIEKWLTLYRLAFPIVGGRAEGYRGYSIQPLSQGTWRCTVETGRGALIGYKTFTAIATETIPALISEVR